MKINDLKSDKTETQNVVTDLGKYIIDKLNTQKRFIHIDHDANFFKGKIKEDAVLLLSDAHVGKKNIYLNPRTGQNEVTYNLDIMAKESNKLANAVFDITSLLSPRYDIDTLWILTLGDLIDNQQIFPGQKFSIECDVGKQLWYAVGMMSDFIKTMLTRFKYIKVVGIPGNHGRLTEKPESMPATSSWDYQLLKILDVYFKDNKNVTFTIPDSYYYLLNILKWKYYLHHGNTIKSWMGLPYYGVSRQSKSRKVEMEYDLELIGHFHQCMEIPVGGRSKTIVNGSWIENDIFAWHYMGILSTANQSFFGVSDKRPRTWTFTLDLGTDRK